MNRPVFYTEKHYEVKAAGVIFYRYFGKQVKFLMIKCNGKYEDFGGKTDLLDTTIACTASREAFEESNGIFDQDLLYEKLKHNRYLYCPHSKYALYFIKTDIIYDCKIFGNYEQYDNIKRTVHWIEIDRLKKKIYISGYILKIFLT